MRLDSDTKRALLKSKEAMPGTPEFKRAKREAIKRSQIERCYVQHTPLQNVGTVGGNAR